MSPNRLAIIGAVVRFVLTAYVGRTLLDEHGVTDAYIDSVVAGVTGFVVLAWSIYGKVRANKRLAAAKAAPAELPR